MEYRYGTKAEEVDKFFQQKRSWSRVKDKILSDYVVAYSRTVPHLLRPILIVDGFAGPGCFGDGEPGSPLLICDAVRKVASKVTARCLFADVRLGHRVALEEALSEHIASGLCERPAVDCEAVVERALDVGRDWTVFYYLDPYGIKDLDFSMLERMFSRSRSLSTEMLINFNFRTFMRMSGNWDYADSVSTIAAQIVKEGKVDTVNRVMGGDYWIAIVTDPALSMIDREDAVIAAYVSRLKELVKFVVSVPVKERYTSTVGVPGDELAHYHLIFGTRSSQAVGYMNDIGLNALEPFLSQFTVGVLFPMTPDRYVPAARDSAKNAILECARNGAATRPELIEAVIPRYFMNYRVKDYRAMINELTFEEGRLFPDRAAMKRAHQLNDLTRLSATPWPGAAS